MAHDLGDIVPLTVEIRDAAGTLTAATSVVLTITLPDGTTATPTVSNPSTGKYQVDHVTTQAGRHLARWVSNGPDTAYVDTFDVRPAAPGYLVSLADTKRHLSLTGTTDRDEQLRTFIEAATRLVESKVGAVVRRSHTDLLRGRGLPFLRMPHAPVISVTSIVDPRTGLALVDVADLDVDTDVGIARRLDGCLFHGLYRVTYVAGRPVVPANFALAAQIIVGHMWETQRGRSFRPTISGDDDSASITAEMVGGLGYILPRRAMQLLEPDLRMPGIA